MFVRKMEDHGFRADHRLADETGLGLSLYAAARCVGPARSTNRCRTGYRHTRRDGDVFVVT